MKTAISIACFVFAVLSFGWGFVTEYRQSRDEGPIAVVPTLPFGVMAGLLVWLGLGWLPYELPALVYIIVIPGAPILFVFAIIKASAGSRSR